MVRKIIKKTGKLITYLLLLAILIPFIALGLLQLPAVQDFAINKVVTYLEKDMGADINYSSFRITNFNKVKINDLYLSDVNGDTLVFSKLTELTVPVIFSFFIDRDEMKPMIKQLALEEAEFNIKIDTAGTLNFQYIIDYFSSDSPDEEESEPILIKEFSLKNCKFNLYMAGAEANQDEEINFSNLQLSRLNARVDNITIIEDIIGIDFQSLSFSERSGFVLNDFEGYYEMAPTYMFVENMSLNSPSTSINLEKAGVKYASFDDFGGDGLYRNVDIELLLKPSRISASDLAYFSDGMKDTKQEILISGDIYGTLSNLKGRNVSLNWGEKSSISGRFNISGLPDPEETFIIFDLNELNTNTRDISRIDLPGDQVLELPEQFNSITSIRYEGNFTGFLNDFVANGMLQTNLGKVYTDLMFAPDSLDQIRLSGRIRTTDFQIGKLINNEEYVKEVSMDASIIGYLSDDKPFNAEIQGEISKLTLMDYPYQNIRVNGRISDKLFSGELNVDDPNLIMTFKGLFDMGSDISAYNFDVNVIDANLYALNISDSDPEYHGSFLLKANASGPSLDEINGEFHLLNSLFFKTNKQIQIYDLNLILANNDQNNRMTIRSDVLDADIRGKYKISDLSAVFMSFLHQHLPNLVKKPEEEPLHYSDTRLEFDMQFKQTESFFNFFFPEYMVAENTQANGEFVPGTDKGIVLNLYSPGITYQKNTMQGMALNIYKEDSLLRASIGCRNFNLNESADLENFTIMTSISQDRIQFDARWLNWDSAVYRGNISGMAIFDKQDGQNIYKFEFNPTSIVISDTLWNISEFALLIDTAGYGIENLRINKRNEYLEASGKISDLPGDTLNFNFDNFSLENLNFILGSHGLFLNGELSGNGNITGKSLNPLFFASLSIKNLVINSEPLGDGVITSLWDNRKQSLTINLEATRGKLTMLKILGDYYPQDNGKMDFAINLNKLKANIINPFLTGIFSDIEGFASGDLQLSGTPKKPTLSGKILLQRAGFTVDYLMTHYTLTTEVDFVNNNIIINNALLYDQEGSPAIVNGMIRNDYFRDMELNIGIRLDKTMCLNTTAEDNDWFYGTAYATGNVKIHGGLDDLRFDVDAKTERGRNDPNIPERNKRDKSTIIYIPLTEQIEVDEYKYISFVRQDEDTSSREKKSDEKQVDLSGYQMEFNLDVTPDAEIQMVWDPTIGDIIKGRGTGKIQMSINTIGTFDMIGNFVIEKGDYLFTLQNVINKKLKIIPGGTLQWTGDPYNAIVDMTAVYNTNAMFSDLVPTITEERDPGRVDVDCRIFLTDLLMSPTIDYDIYLPYADEETRDMVRSKTQGEEELSKQFISLLVMGRFMPAAGLASNAGSESVMAGKNNAMELLSNQLSNWLSQISNDFDVEVNYHPGQESELTPSELEVMLSTQFLNDRLSINGSVDMKSDAAVQNTAKFAGNFDADYKLNEKGKVRLRAFNHSNDNIADNDSDYTQGFGIIFKDEYDSLGELWKRYWEFITGKRKEKAETVEETSGKKTEE
ncbi:MAG: translocation/assembly module TamB domain-containing protein [Bacteroidales bacterium]|nr:translocation/assembly module TamB domain-containing protein [Bacteroidales bacterium]